MPPSLSGLPFVNPHTHTDASSPARSPDHGVVPASNPSQLSVETLEYDVVVTGAGTTMSLEDFLETTHTTSLVVVVDGRVVTERYADGVGATDLLLGASMSKSLLATVTGMAVGQGILGLDDDVTKHVPELGGSGYDGARVVDVITMTTGVDWTEDHRDPDSRASRLVRCFREGRGGSRDLLASVPSRAPPGTRFEYCTADSLVLDWVRERAAGTNHLEALAELWAAMGAETDATVAMDASSERGGVAMAGGGVAATARDWARLAMLQVDGCLGGQRLLDASWVDVSSLPTYPFLRPGRLPSSITTHAGFGYHWWPLDDGGRTVTADGMRGQFAYVDRDLRTVVVKTSQWPYEDFLSDRQYRDLCYLALPEIARRAAAAAATSAG